MKTYLQMLGFTARDAREAAVNNSITDGNIETAPSEDAVHAALKQLRDIHVTAYWYSEVTSGTTGTVTPPSGSIALDRWPDGVDAVASQIGTDGAPNWETPLTSAGSPVTVALDADGNYTLSDTPDSYPVAVIYAYRTTLAEFDDTQSMAEAELDQLASGVFDDSEVDQGDVAAALTWLKDNRYTDSEAVSAVNAETSLSVDITGNADTATDADTLDGSHLADIQSEIDGDISDHADISDAHHSRYTDSEAVSAVNNDADHGATAQHDYFSGSHQDLTDVNSDDHHSRYTDSEAVSAAEGAAVAVPGDQSAGLLIKWNENGELPATMSAGVIGTPGQVGFGAGICPPEVLLDGMTPLSGYTDPTNDNYGNYQFEDGSVMVFVPKFYYRINHSDNPTHSAYAPNDVDIKGVETFSGEAAANIVGYALHRAFKDGDGEGNMAVHPGVFVDKYMCSKNAKGSGYVASSIKDGLPISTHADHNPIADLTACDSNNYYQCIAAAHARDGVDGAVNSNSRFFASSRFVQSALGLPSLAHGQAATSTTYCAWYGTSNNYPKGCNDNSLGDTDDAEVTYVSDGYSNCGKTGSGTPFAKTTHNGQNCGIADVNGLMYEVNTGFVRDSGDNDFYVLDESTKISTLTSGTGGAATDAWGDATHLETLYSVITLGHIAADATNRFGNPGHQTLSAALSGDGYRMTGIGLPKDSDAKSSGGSDLFGEDYLREYHRADMCALSCCGWSNGSRSGGWAFYLGVSRAVSSAYGGFRCACYPDLVAR